MANLLFPLNARRVKWTSQVEDSWDVTEQKSASGKRRAITSQTRPGWQFTIDFPALTAEERDTLFAFRSRVKGSLIPFFYKDAESYHCEKLRLARHSDGSYQLVANMHGQQEITYYADKLTVWVNGAERTAQEYAIDRGAIVFNQPPSANAVVTATYDYWWQVVFAKKSISVKQKFVNLFECSIVLVVVR